MFGQGQMGWAMGFSKQGGEADPGDEGNMETRRRLYCLGEDRGCYTLEWG